MTALHIEGERTLALGAAELLCYAAAPAFAAMALLSALSAGGPLEVMCGATLWTGMTPMYALMSIVHLPCWLRLIAAKPVA